MYMETIATRDNASTGSSVEPFVCKIAAQSTQVTSALRLGGHERMDCHRPFTAAFDFARNVPSARHFAGLLRQCLERRLRGLLEVAAPAFRAYDPMPIS